MVNGPSLGEYRLHPPISLKWWLSMRRSNQQWSNKLRRIESGEFGVREGGERGLKRRGVVGTLILAGSSTG